MLKAVKNYHYNKKKKTLQHLGIRYLEEYVCDEVSDCSCIRGQAMFIFHFKGRAQIQDVGEEGAVDNVWK